MRHIAADSGRQTLLNVADGYALIKGDTTMSLRSPRDFYRASVYTCDP